MKYKYSQLVSVCLTCYPISAYYVPLSYVWTRPYALQIFFFIFHLDRVFENMIALIKPIIAVHLLKITHNFDNSTYLDLLPYFLNSHIKENQKNQAYNNPCVYDDRL